MAIIKLFNLVAVTALALFVTSFAPTPVDALSGRSQHLNRHIAHEAIAKRKRDAPKRCKPRPSTSLAASSTHSTSHTSTHPHSSSTAKAAPAAQTPKADPAPSSGGSDFSSTHNGPGKVCLAWPNGPNNLDNFLTENVKALYTWSPDGPSKGDLHGVDFFPMLWGDRQVTQFENDVKGGGDFILGFNEPNESGQSNMTPQHGCDLWHEHMEPKVALGYKLISPAPSSRPNGLDWVKSFLQCCSDCHVHGIAVHWYDMSASKLQTYLESFHNAFPNMPIYLTEYALQNFNGGAQATMDQIWAFHQEMGPWINSQDWMALHCPFGFMTDMQGVNPLNQLMDNNGNPTPLGSMIINNTY